MRPAGSQAGPLAAGRRRPAALRPECMNPAQPVRPPPRASGGWTGALGDSEWDPSLQRAGRAVCCRVRGEGAWCATCSTATCDEWQNGKSISSIDTGHAGMEHGARDRPGSRDAASPPELIFPFVRNNFSVHTETIFPYVRNNDSVRTETIFPYIRNNVSVCTDL